MLLDEIEENKERLLDVFHRYGVTRISITGSVARRQERDESDIDFIGLFREPPEEDLNHFSTYNDLVEELKRVLDTERKIQILDERKRYFKGYESANREAICLEP